MKISDCLSLLTSTLSTTGVPAPQGTPYNRVASSLIGMARAYERDGILFLASGDPVNALAAGYYAFGWLHFGLATGLLDAADPVRCPFTGQPEILPAVYRSKLEEKSHRYARLLSTAVSSVGYAPDQAAEGYHLAARTLSAVRLYHYHGERLLESGICEESLSCLCYGHGWLDGGVAAGLFRVQKNREIFCV